MTNPQIFDHRGRSLALGALIRRGGEGAVFDVAGQPALVAKLYDNAPDQDKADKLRSMLASGAQDLTRVAAWPITTLHDRPSGPLRGFVMPKIVGHKEIHKLYGPSHRQREFPDANWAFLIHTAANCAAAFETIHGMKHLMGDVNPGNVLVSAQALVTLIDCDSFQVQFNGRTFRCEVGVPEYTPPELQGLVFRNVSRTENHDRFGLAVLIFHLLFMGRHPFAGRHSGPGDMTLDRAIRECRFPFARTAGGRKGMDPPPLAPTLDIVTPAVASLFERAFQDPGQGIRPSANEWHAALDDLERQLLACPRERAHRYARHLSACPWCRFEDGTPPVLFFISPGGGLSFLCGAADLAPILAGLEHLTWPQLVRPPTAVPMELQVAPLPETVLGEQRRAKVVRAALAISGLVLLTGLIVLVFMPIGLFVAIGGAVGTLVFGVWSLYLARTSQLGHERQRRRFALNQAQAVQEHVIAEWQNAFDRSARTASEARLRIDSLCKEYGELKPSFDVEIAQLEQSREAAQRRDYLRNELIADAVINGIGSNVKNALLSEGIESALDVLTRGTDGIPGIGEKRRAALTVWADSVDLAFRFDPKKDVPAVERRVIVARYSQRQYQIKTQLERRVSGLRQLAQAATDDVENVRQRLTTATGQLAQAQVNWIAVQ
ncbi:MAG TPA: hypothetical protein VFK02_34040 [Kofleriaceae bacterium]|nr:hypothetical protein [Kofleriaceae bacterium]